MNKIKLILILLLSGCSPKISEHFEYNRYIRNYNIHLINDSLQIYFKSPADIVYTTNRKKLKKIISKVKFNLENKVLAHGKTNEPPYEYYVTESKTLKQNFSENLVVFDTLINNKNIQFIGNPLSEKSKKTLEIDLKNIFNSLEIGTNYRKEISTIMDVVSKYKESNKFYAALNEISEFPTYDQQEEWTKFQMELTFASFLGDNSFYRVLLDKLESRFKPNKKKLKLIKDHIETDAQAIERIVNEAKNHKITMINENHFYPNHRLLIMDLLLNLKEIGYTHLALEALDSKQDSLLNLDNAYPNLNTGFYTREQNYGNLIRKAKSLGYKFVSYENTNRKINREIGQAENLYNKTFKTNKNLKVLVLAGIDHILEKETNNGKKWMAAVFKNKYNINPLTISQTHLNSDHNNNTDYGIIKSDIFENHKIKSVDYLLLNNKISYDYEGFSTYSYKNNTDNNVQVALFYENEILKKYDYHNRTPYYSNILKSEQKLKLPIKKNSKVHLYIFNNNGKKIEHKIIKM